ncbi:MAG: cob(I)yrinic acid a,c-diamide adenosyltransferase [Muribaculaceae bacterium]|nr:cob(I)yrinic acid a,c-diamide adenosyltransferase [Muribaculaceae bacterium]
MTKKSNVYTRTGDSGTTSLVGGTRVPKTHPRLEAYGTVDELNSWLGLLIQLPEVPAPQKEVMAQIQHKLFDIGCMLATEPDSAWQPQSLPESALTAMENAIDTMDAQLPVHNRFILPGGTCASAYANIARTVARRTERRILTLAQDAPVDPLLIKYINRLSDYLFILSRAINISCGASEIFWNKNC